MIYRPQLRTCSDGDRSSSGWYKGAMSSLVLYGGSPSLGKWEKKMGSFLPSLAYNIKIDRYRASSTPTVPVYTLATKILQGNQPLTDGGVWCQWYHACYLLAVYTMTCMSCTPRSEKSRAVFDTHIIYHGMPGWVVERYDYAELRVLCKYCLPVNYTTCLLYTSPSPRD